MNMPSFLFWGLSLIAFLLPATAVIYTSTFDPTVQAPANIYRTTYSASLAGSSKTFTVTFPTSSYNVTPIVLYSITSLTFSKGIYFNLSMINISLNFLTAQISYDSTVTSVSFSFLIMDSTLYSANFSYFVYSMPIGTNSPQSIPIVNNSQHAASFMVQLKLTLGPHPSGFAPGAQSVILDTNTFSNIGSTNLTISYDPSQVYINRFRMYFVDFNLTNFLASPGLSYGQQFAIYGDNGLITDQTQTNSYFSIYANNFFTGLQTLYDTQFIFSTSSFDVTNYISNNVYYYTSNLLLVSYHCPSSFPVTDATRTYCYSSCDVGFYADTQMICQPCNSNCYTCIGIATNCTGCNSPYVLIYGFVCGCNSTSYQLIINSTIYCYSCSSAILYCRSCSSNTNCSLCFNNLILVDAIYCGCPNATNQTVIGQSAYCIDDIPVAQQNCTFGMQPVDNICSCPINFTLMNGACL